MDVMGAPLFATPSFKDTINIIGAFLDSQQGCTQQKAWGCLRLYLDRFGEENSFAAQGTYLCFHCLVLEYTNAPDHPSHPVNRAAVSPD